MVVGAVPTAADGTPAAAAQVPAIDVGNAPAAPMQGTPARRAETPRGRALSPTVVGTGGSPRSKRPVPRTAAAVPPAPGREMTMQEVTHSLQHIMAQQTHDTEWITTTKAHLEDHAELIDDNATNA